ncbi:MAG TPA: hypothetical protein VH722_12810 [Alphaproteobacteria bacterium]|jgi:hypothetical protein|nr:hypothetical protein [Alphaproteobacteria bacterium]
MIYPDDKQLLGGIADALKDTVLPDLARGSAARKQLQAAIETLRRMAFAAPERDAALAADVADMEGVIARVEALLPRHSPPPSLPPQGGGMGGGEIIQQHLALQQQLADLQAAVPENLTAQVTPLLTQLYARMTDRALALIPPPIPRTPRTPA